MRVFVKGSDVPLTAAVFDVGCVLLHYEADATMKAFGVREEDLPRFKAAVVETPVWIDYNRGLCTIDDAIAHACSLEPSFRPQIENFVRGWVDYCPEIDSNVALFRKLKAAGLKTYILSNFMEDCYEWFRERMPVLNERDGEVVSYQCHLSKPDPAIYRKLFELYPEIVPGSTVYFDDMAKNAEAGRNAGLLAVKVEENEDITKYLEFRD